MIESWSSSSDWLSHPSSTTFSEPLYRGFIEDVSPGAGRAQSESVVLCILSSCGFLLCSLLQKETSLMRHISCTYLCTHTHTTRTYSLTHKYICVCNFFGNRVLLYKHSWLEIYFIDRADILVFYCCGEIR